MKPLLKRKLIVRHLYGRKRALLEDFRKICLFPEKHLNYREIQYF